MSPYFYDDLDPGESELCDCGTTLLELFDLLAIAVRLGGGVP